MTFYEPYPRRITPDSSRSSRAATQLKQAGGTFVSVAEQFGITPEAVRQAWIALAYGELPERVRLDAANAQALELLRAGELFAPQIAKTCGLSRSTVYKLAKLYGLALKSRARFLQHAELEPVIAAIVARTMTVGKGALVLGCDSRELARELRRRDIRLNRGYSAKTARALPEDRRAA